MARSRKSRRPPTFEPQPTRHRAISFPRGGDRRILSPPPRPGTGARGLSRPCIAIARRPQRPSTLPGPADVSAGPRIARNRGDIQAATLRSPTVDPSSRRPRCFRGDPSGLARPASASSCGCLPGCCPLTAVCCLSCILPVPIARHTRVRPCRRPHDPPVRFRRTAAAACAGRARRTSRVTHHSCPLPPPFRGWGVILVSATLLSRSRSDVRDTRNDRRAKGPRKKPLVAPRFFLPAVQALSKPGGRGEMWRRRDPPATAS